MVALANSNNTNNKETAISCPQAVRPANALLEKNHSLSVTSSNRRNETCTISAQVNGIESVVVENSATIVCVQNVARHSSFNHHDYTSMKFAPEPRQERNVGIVAMEIYFPSQFVDQEELERYDNVSAGKYTVGLGQSRMAVPTEADDVNSICLSVVSSLLSKYNISPNEIGRLEVGTESIVDKSKSVKSTLMQLFAPATTDKEHSDDDFSEWNSEVVGIDCINACYGGTAALFNSICWMESEEWDGRYALVVAGDISVYARGPARPTGGVGAVAILLGPNGSIQFERGLAGHHMEHVYDFYKPHLASEYPEVDGKLSIECYLKALEITYQRWNAKFAQRYPMVGCGLEELDYVAFHSPYVKLVQKGAARLYWTTQKIEEVNNKAALCACKPLTPPMLDVPDGKVIFRPQTPVNKRTREPIHGSPRKLVRCEEWSRELERDMVQMSSTFYQKKVAPTLRCASQIGNMYTGSIFGSIISLLCSETCDDLVGKRIGVFSYGSGLAASFYSMRVVNDGYLRIREAIDLERRLLSRTIISPSLFEQILDKREKMYQSCNIKIPESVTQHYPEGSFYLAEIDEQCRRNYKQCSSFPINE